MQLMGVCCRCLGSPCDVSSMTTEVAANPSVGHAVLSARHYEVGPPASVTLDVVSSRLLYCLFNDAVNISLYTPANDRISVKNKLRRL
jgi:hypothetical protein